MTREEAIKVLKNPHDASDERIAKAIDMAIEALELVTSYEDTINKLREAIADTAKRSRWIPASERLPDKLKDVLIAFEDCPNEYDVAYLRTTFNESYKKNGAKNEWVSSMGEATYADYEVSAWMLIEPYKAESEE